MSSRSTAWRRRQRIQKFLSQAGPNNLSATNLTDNRANDFRHQSNNFSSETQSDTFDDEEITLSKATAQLFNTIDNHLKLSDADTVDAMSTNEEVNSNDDNEKQSEDSEIFHLSAEPSTREIAAVLGILKARHQLSNRCLDHFCKLMRSLKTPNVPKDSAHIKRLLLPDCNSDSAVVSFYCSICNTMSSNEVNCSNVNCSEHKRFSKKPSIFVRMPLRSQLRNILLRFPSSLFRQQLNSTCSVPLDITSGQLYKAVVKQEGDNFISLVMNVDGIEISKSSKSSLWVITFVINELEQSERFKMQNVLVGGIGAGANKPTREEMKAYMQPIIKELSNLETEHRFRTIDEYNLVLKVFLLAGSMDKPAQALVQNLAEPNGSFGCGKCCIMGITVPINSKSLKRVRVFPLRKTDVHPKLRSNFAYDVKMAIPENFRPKQKVDRRNFMQGYMGECGLRDLRYFDVGRCFAFDTLHNLYRGTFSRLLDLWFDTEHRHQPWSLRPKIEQIDVYLSVHKFPSTTCRIPRTILKYNQFKANELRSVLLFGFSPFSMYLPKRYARHFLMLVIAAHLCESKSITSDQIVQIKQLTTEFIYQFPLLYGDRHNVISIHWIFHLAESIRDFGSVYNYSTFNFESYLGTLRSTVHSTHRHALEIRSNVNLLRSSCVCINEKSFHPRLADLIKRIQPGLRNEESFDSRKHIQLKTIEVDKNLYENLRTIFNNDIKLYKTIIFNGVRYTTVNDQSRGQKDDSCVLYTAAKTVRAGFITTIIQTSSNQNDCIIKIRDAPISRYLSMTLNGIQIDCRTVMFSNANETHSSFFVRPTDIIEKLSYVFDDASKFFILFRFPNMLESS